MAPYERVANTDHAGFQKKIHASLEKMKTHSILQKLRESDDRYEISPTLKLIFSPEQIVELTRQYRELAQATDAPVAVDPEGVEDVEDSQQ